MSKQGNKRKSWLGMVVVATLLTVVLLSSLIRCRPNREGYPNVKDPEIVSKACSTARVHFSTQNKEGLASIDSCGVYWSIREGNDTVSLHVTLFHETLQDSTIESVYFMDRDYKITGVHDYTRAKP